MNWTLSSIGLGGLLLAGSWALVHGLERSERASQACFAPEPEPDVSLGSGAALLAPPASVLGRIAVVPEAAPLQAQPNLDQTWDELEAELLTVLGPQAADEIDYRLFSRASPAWQGLQTEPEVQP